MKRRVVRRPHILREAILMRHLPVVSPLWALYHGRGGDLVREMDELGASVAWDLQAGPLFGDATVFGSEWES